MILLAHYDRERGWENTKPGWYEVSVNINGTIKKYADVLRWLKEHIDMHERHCRWIYQGDTMDVKFRYQKDYVWFNLTWG